MFFASSLPAFYSAVSGRLSPASVDAKSTRSASSAPQVLIFSNSAVHDAGGSVLQHNVMAAALDDGGGGHDGQLGLLLQLGDGERAAVAHGALDLVQSGLDAVRQRAGIRDVAVHALLEAQLGGAAEVVALPVAGTVGAFAPVLLHILAVDAHLVRGAFVEAGKVAAQHDEVCAHGQSEGDVVIVDDAAVRADGHIDAGFLVILIAGLGHLDDSGSLTAADALGLAGDADGAAADADLHEVCASLGEEAETLGVHDVACAHLDGITVVLTDPADGAALPLRVALGGVDAEDIHTSLHQCGHALGVVAGVDAGADHIALVLIQQLVGILLVGVVILAEDDILQVALGVHQRQGVDLVVPDDVVAVVQRGVLRSSDQLLDGGHEGGDGGVVGGVVDAVIAGSHDAQQLAVGGAVGGDGDGGVAGAGLQLQHIMQGGSGGQIGVGDDVACLEALDAADHSSLVLDALGAVDEGDAALTGQRDGQLIAGDRLHDSADHGDVHFQRAGLLALAVLDQRGLEADRRGDVLGRRVARHQQVLAKGTGGFFVKISHVQTPFS